MKTSGGRLDGKVAIVAGGSRGIGQQIAVELLQEGASVAVISSKSSDQSGAFAGSE